MKKVFIKIFLPLLFLTGIWQYSIAQPTSEEITNLQQKYWYYRYRLLNDFVVVGGQPGQSLCATKRSGNGHNALSYGDATIHHGWYLGTLATEYKLLASNSNVTAEELQLTLTELYFAMQAVNRLDFAIEGFYGEPNTPLNGFFARSDNEANFLNELFSTQDIILNDSILNSTNIGVGPEVSVIRSDAVAVTNPGTSNRCWSPMYDVEESQDQFINVTFGLAFIVKCLPDQNIFLESLNINYNFHDEAVNIWGRLLNWVADGPPGSTAMTCENDNYGATVQGFQTNGALSAATLGLLLGFPVAGAVGAVAATELDRFIIYNPATDTIVHRGAFAWAYAQPISKGYQKITGINGPTPISWSGLAYELNQPGFDTDNDAMSSVLGTICDCWGINTVNKLTTFGGPHHWQNFYVPALKFLHSKNISIGAYTDDLFTELSAAPCYGPAYFTSDNPPAPMAHRNTNNTNPDQFYNSDATGWGAHLRYYKSFDQQFRVDDYQDETVGFLPGLGFMLAHNIYLLSVNENNANFNSYYRNRYSIVSQDVFPKLYNGSHVVGLPNNPLEMYAFEGIRSRDEVKPDGQGEYRAGQSIRFLPGTHLQEGSLVWAHIDPFDCTGGVTNNGNGGYYNSMAARGVESLNGGSVHDVIFRASPPPAFPGAKIAPEREAENNEDKEVSIYPNPCNGGDVHLSWEAEDGQATITIIDLSGRIVHTQTSAAGAGKTMINIDAYPAGSYFVELKLSNKTVREKLIKL